MATQATVDRGLPTLCEVFDPARMAEHLERTLPERCHALRDVDFHVLKHHPQRRCTFEIELTTPRERSSLIGKVYASDRSDVYRAMERIARSGFGPEDECSIPEPLAYLPELHLLLQEKVAGRRAKLVFLDERADVTEPSARAAKWLARFHATAPRAGRTTHVTDHVVAVERWSQRIARLGEPLRGQARRLAQWLTEEAVVEQSDDVCAGHGSYHCHQIILAPRRTVTVDWDGYDVAHPSRDVARFVVQLQRLAVKYFGSIRALDPAVDVFLRTYRAHSPYDVSANLAWYRALTCLRLAKYEANRPVCTFPQGIAALLREGLHVLEEGGTS